MVPSDVLRSLWFVLDCSETDGAPLADVLPGRAACEGLDVAVPCEAVLTAGDALSDGAEDGAGEVGEAFDAVLLDGEGFEGAAFGRTFEKIDFSLILSASIHDLVSADQRRTSKNRRSDLHIQHINLRSR